MNTTESLIRAYEAADSLCAAIMALDHVTPEQDAAHTAALIAAEQAMQELVDRPVRDPVDAVILTEFAHSAIQSAADEGDMAVPAVGVILRKLADSCTP